MSARRKAPLQTRKHLARAQREQRMRLALLIGSVVIGAAVLGLLGVGWYRSRVVAPRQPVATVDGMEISTGDFQGRVRLSQWNLVNQISNLEQFLALLGDSPELQANYQSQLLNLRAQLANSESLGATVLDQMIADALIFREAQRRGIQVSSLEVERDIEQAFGFYAEGTPTSPPATATPQASPSDQAAEPLATPMATATPDPDATPTASPTPYTRDLFERNYDAYLSNLRSFGIHERDLQAQWEAELYRQRLLERFAGEVAEVQEQVWARHILVADETTAVELLGRLLSGEDWDALAFEYSLDESNKELGGDLGWFGRGRMVEAFEEAAFAGQVGDVIGPVESEFGWHLIEVLGHEDRQLDPAGIQSEANLAFNLWLNAAREAADTTIAEDWIERVPGPPL